jgi:hypothetical protein
MQPTFDSQAAARILHQGIEKGYWTIEDLDRPSPGTELNCQEYKRYLTLHKYCIKEPNYRNLLRERVNETAIEEDDFIL